MVRSRSRTPALRYGAAATAALAPVAAGCAALAGDGSTVLAALAGLVLVAAFFTVSVVLVAAADRVDPALTLPVALGTYLVKVVVLGVTVYRFPPPVGENRTAFALAVVGGVIAWVTAQAVGVWRAKIPYVQLDAER